MSQVNTSMNFLPEDYVEKRQAARAAVVFIGLLLLVVSLLSIGFVVGRAIRRPTAPLVIQRNIVTNTADGNQTPAPVLLDDTYICGARTKKGTPCSRRVHGQVRCWQHKGMAAMLPVEKLKIRE